MFCCWARWSSGWLSGIAAEATRRVVLSGRASPVWSSETEMPWAMRSLTVLEGERSVPVHEAPKACAIRASPDIPEPATPTQWMRWAAQSGVLVVGLTCSAGWLVMCGRVGRVVGSWRGYR